MNEMLKDLQIIINRINGNNFKMADLDDGVKIAATIHQSFLAKRDQVLQANK